MGRLRAIKVQLELKLEPNFFPEWQKEDDSSDIEEEPSLTSTMSTKDEDFRRELTLGLQRDSRMAISRERTTISLADFYAPSPEPQTTGNYEEDGQMVHMLTLLSRP